MPQGSGTLAALMVGATAFISLAVPLELEREWITVAWALEVAALAWLELRLGLRALRYLGALLAGLVSVRLLLNPAVLGYPIGTGIIWNWILYGYGVPIAAFAWSAGALRRLRETAIAEALEVLAVALGFALVTLQARQYFHPADLGASGFYLAEWGAYSVLWLAYGIGLLHAWKRAPRPALLWGGAVAGWLGIGLALLAQGLATNPLWTPRPVGDAPVLNKLLFLYGLPAVLALLFAGRLRRYAWWSSARCAAIASLALWFILVNLEVRQGFHGSILAGPRPTNAEWYAYSAAWVGFGTTLLAVGILTGGVTARYASLIVMLAAVLKVFLFDTKELKDLYRVVSFLGLGASLLLLAFLYQRFVFRRRD